MLLNCAMCYGVKRKQCIVELCIALWCEEESMHCGIMYCIMVQSGSWALWNCALHCVIENTQCTVGLCMVLVVKRKMVH